LWLTAVFRLAIFLERDEVREIDDGEAERPSSGVERGEGMEQAYYRESDTLTPKLGELEHKAIAEMQTPSGAGWRSLSAGSVPGLAYA
jgi:hypothetical protein